MPFGRLCRSRVVFSSVVVWLIIRLPRVSKSLMMEPDGQVTFSRLLVGLGWTLTADSVACSMAVERLKAACMVWRPSLSATL